MQSDKNQIKYLINNIDANPKYILYLESKSIYCKIYQQIPYSDKEKYFTPGFSFIFYYKNRELKLMKQRYKLHYNWSLRLEDVVYDLPVEIDGLKINVIGRNSIKEELTLSQGMMSMVEHIVKYESLKFLR